MLNEPEFEDDPINRSSAFNASKRSSGVLRNESPVKENKNVPTKPSEKITSDLFNLVKYLLSFLILGFVLFFLLIGPSLSE